MKTTTFKPEKFLRPTHRKQEIAAEVIQDFKQKLNTFLANIHEPSREGKQETDLRDFLNDALYRAANRKDKFYINKKETIDWAIHNGMDAKSKVAVLIEVKKTAEKTDMFTEAKPNVKAFHELVLYYLRERIDNNNHEIKHLIATNCHEWYIFNELWFNENIFTTQLKKTYQEWKLSGHGTDDFYKFHAKTYLETLEKPLEFCRIDLRDYVKASDKKVSELYKILSPEHLLKQEIANDANKLNKPFYNELLYLIGIEERKDEKSNKKIIERLLPAHRKEGSLLENTIEQLETKNALSKVQNLEAFGDTEEEQKYSVALELCITWLNRLLFLKLLEGQLIKYHGGDRKYRFLTSERINDFDELGELFFGVLAKRPEDRRPSVQQKFGDIPYLNSSLFEESNLENNVLSVELLKDRLELPLFGSTVLKDSNGKTRKGEVKTLKYLLDFLDSYDFGSKDAKEVAATKDSNAINHDRTINAAVLGLIFEKLNGYKDGSFFTPSFITMYMCRETLRRSVVQKFNDTQNWNCQDFAELHEHLDDDYKKPEKRKAYNDLLNSIRICDPAVGSGHFLVSALNEMIAIKAELKILQHPNGSRLKGYEISVENDELIVWDEETQKDFQYKIGQGGKPIQELQLVQETLFHEKRTIIENCLFGVDINPKSVSICQLRLWIELLKNAFYTPESKYLYLETLPNIDINIKTGNSLVSRFGLDADLSKVLRSIKYTVTQYRGFVNDYKNAENKEQKRGLQKIIDGIKANFRTEIAKYSNPKVLQLNKLKEELYVRFEGNSLFGTKLNAKQKAERDILSKKIESITTEIKDSIDSPIFRNAFEWRFEFPEVLDDNGNFIGFDVIIGNPPYVRSRENFGDVEKKFFSLRYKTASYQADLYKLFIELGTDIISDKGILSFITPSVFLTNDYDKPLRKYLLDNFTLDSFSKPNSDIFDEANVVVSVFQITPKKIDTNVNIFEIINKEFVNCLVQKQLFYVDNDYLINSNFDNSNNSLLNKIGSFPMLELNFEVKNGIKVRKELLFDKPLDETFKPFVLGRHIRPFFLLESGQFIHYTKENESKYTNQAFRTHEIFEQPKIIVRQIPSKKIIVTYDESNIFTDQTTYIINHPEKNVNELKYLSSILSSKLMYYYFSNTMGDNKELFPKIKRSNLLLLPIPKSQLIFIEKVNQILAFKKEDSQADTSKLEAEIDRMVYELYELTEEEILIVEGK
jgi:adenine-specific DNA-methyltransferase